MRVSGGPAHTCMQLDSCEQWAGAHVHAHAIQLAVEWYVRGRVCQPTACAS